MTSDKESEQVIAILLVLERRESMVMVCDNADDSIMAAVDH